MILNSIEIDDVTFYGDKVNMICRADSLRVGINELCFSFTSALLLFDIRDFEIIIIIWEPVLVGSIQNHFSKQMIWDGFSYPESEFRWTDGVFAYILFRHEGSVEDIRLRLLYSSFGEQRVALFLNSVQIYRGILSGDKVDLIIDLPSLQNGHNVLRFILPEAQSPGETDLRKLAIAVREFELVKKQP
jgi:hypothetical protein